jgi:AraC-like DNA-binding protein
MIVYTGMGAHGNAKSSQRYRLEGLWALHVYDYEGSLVLGKKLFALHPGCVSLIPPDTAFRHVWHRPGSTHFFSLFKLKAQPRSSPPSPLVYYRGDFAAKWRDLLVASVPWATSQPHRASARLWDALWELTEAHARAPAPPETEFEKATRLIEENSGSPITVTELARQVGKSHNQLTRLFQARLGVSVIEHMRAQRWNRVRHLLTQTNLPVKSIAIDLGFRHLSYFNAFVRSFAGCGPRAFRLCPIQRQKSASKN